MKRIFTILLASLLVLTVSAPLDAQNRKAERKARRELRRQERAIKDSLMAVMRQNDGDSVYVGYGYTKKRSLSSSVSRLDGSVNMETYSTVADYIQGRVPGVMVQRSGQTVRYIIRGIGTNSDATDPLLLIDGVEVDNFDSITPSQVESIEVIKDGSSAIYGIRGANGVIMISTKN